MTQHTELAGGRWYKMSIAEQLGNVGGEYERASKWKRQDNQIRFDSALIRFLELIDLTINDPRWSVSRKKELLRVREVCCGIFFGDKSESGVSKYFFQFALLARLGR